MEGKTQDLSTIERHGYQPASQTSTQKPASPDEASPRSADNQQPSSNKPQADSSETR